MNLLVSRRILIVAKQRQAKIISCAHEVRPYDLPVPFLGVYSVPIL
jgi:hypothetical protein